MTRPTVRIGGEIQGGGSALPEVPDWIAEGAIAAWDLQESSGAFEDAGDNLWDVPQHGVGYAHGIFSGKVHRRLSSITYAAYADARIVSEITVAALLVTAGTVAAGGISCHVSSKDTALWGIGQDSGNISPVFFDKRHGGSLLPSPDIGMGAGATPIVFFATRASDGVTKLYLDGALVRTTGAVAAPSVLGTEVLTFYGQAVCDHVGLWDSDLSEAEVIRLTKKIKPWLDI
jgi:hypothetical protein